MNCVNVHIFVNLSNCFWFLISFQGGQKTYFLKISIFYNILQLVLVNNLSWKMFHVHLSIMLFCCCWLECLSIHSNWFIMSFQCSVDLMFSCQVLCPPLKVQKWSLQLFLLNWLFLPSIQSVFISCILGLCC